MRNRFLYKIIDFCKIMFYNLYMLNDFTKMPIDLLTNKVKVCISTLGLNERYNSFEYLTMILVYMLKNDTDSIEAFHTALSLIENKFKISERAICYGINKLFKMCNKEQIQTRVQYQLSNNSTLNKIRVIKTYILNTLSNVHN